MHQPEVLRAGDLEVRPADHLAVARGRAMALSERELELLAALVRRQGRIVPRDELYESVWRAPLRAHDRSVDVYVHKLRSKLARAIPECGFIHTHFGFGYRFEPEYSAGSAGRHRHSARLVGEHTPFHPFHGVDQLRQEDGYG